MGQRLNQGQSQGKSSQQEDGNPSSQSQNIVVNALGMALGTLSSRLLGLVRDQLFTALFSRTVTDAWAAAFRLPNMFRRLLGEGSLAVSFVPIFVQERLGDDPERTKSQNLVNSFYTMLLVVLSVITALGIIFPKPFLSVVLDQAYSAVPGKFELTVRMTQIMFGFIFLMSTYAYFMGILNALGKFALASFAPTLWNVSMIISTLVPQHWFPMEGDSLAWGVLLGGALQVLILVPSLRRFGYLPKLNFNFKNASALRVWKNMLPGMLGMGLSHITTVVNLRFTSSLGEGPISHIYLADRLLELPLSLVSVSLGTALLPTLAEFWAAGKVQESRQTTDYYLRLNWFVAIPAAVGLYMLSLPILTVLFQHGRYTAADVASTVTVLQIYALSLLCISAVRVLVPSFYAMKNTWLPASVSAVCLVVHLILAPILMRDYGLRGLVSSTLVSSTLNLIGLGIAYQFLVTPMGWFRLFFKLWKPLLGGLGMVLCLHGLEFVGPATEAAWVVKALFLAIQIVFSLGVFVIITWFFKSEELVNTFGTLSTKLMNKLKRLKKRI